MEVNGNKIVIDIGGSAGNAVKEIDKAISALNRLKRASNSTNSNPMKGFADSVDRATRKILEQNSIWKRIGKVASATFRVAAKNIKNDMGGAAKTIKLLFGSAYKAASDALSPLFQRLSDGFKGSASKISAFFGDSFSRVKKYAESSFKNIFGESAFSSLKNGFSRVSDGIKNIFSSIKGSVSGDFFGKLISGAKGAAFTILQPLALVAKVVGGVATTIGGKLSRAFSVAGKNALSFGKTIFSIPFRGVAKGVTNFTSKIGTLASSFKRILFYRAIRTIIKQIGDAFREGTQNLYYYSQGIGGQFAASMDMAATSMLYFKNSIGAAVAPLVNALAPVLDMIVDKVVAVINAINQLFAKLTGASSWTRAVKYPKQYGDAVSGAGRAAKEALKYLAPFDELNVLPSDNAGGGGASGLADDYSSMFEEMSEFNQEIADFAKNIREAIEKSDWKGLGELVGGKVNEIVDRIDFAGAGKKIGYYINAWFTTKYWTLETINFTNIGSKIAEFLNNTISEIDFETVGRAFSRGFTLIFDFVLGFITNLDWKQIGKSVGDYLRGTFNEISDWSKTVNWAEFGKNLWTDVMNFIAGIDFGSLAKSFFSFLGSAFGAAVSVIGGFFVGVWESVREYFRKKTEEAGGDTWEGFKKGVTDAWRGIKEWVRTNVIDPFVNSVKSLLGIHSPSTVFANIGINVVQGLWNGVKSTWDKFTGWFSQKWNGLKNWWRGLSLGTFHFKLPHLSWYTEPASGWIGSVLSALGLPSSVPKLSVSWYARGGIVDGASLIGAGEAGKEAIVPLERNTQWVGMVADQLANQLGNRNSGGYNADLADDLEDANGVVVSAIFSATAEIVRAMQRNSGSVQGGNIDIDSIARQVTRWQNNAARANGI